MSTGKNKNIFIGVAFDEVWSRLEQETDIKYLKDLAEIVGVTQQNVSSRKQENLFPYGWGYLVGQKYGLSTEWIIKGEGTKRLSEPSEIKFQILKDLENWLSEVVVSNPDRRQWFSVMIYDTFPMFAEWAKRREEKESRDSKAAGKNVA